MKKLVVLLILISTFMLTSCSTDVAIHTQEMPPTEQEWANTLMHWYPDWQPPVVVHKE